MRSLRARIALIAGLSTALVAIALGIVLSNVLRASLTNEIEDAVVDQVESYIFSVYDSGDIGFAGISLDAETLAVVITEDGDLLDSNDVGIDGDELASQLDLGAVGFDDIIIGDLTLESPDELIGEDNLRFAMARMTLEPEFGIQPIHLVARSLDGVDATVTTVRTGLALAIPLLSLFVSALAWWLTGRALRPVDRLRQQVDEIEADDLTRRVSAPGSAQEVDRLVATMNRMLGRVDEGSQRQRRFASDAAHELRTPLASMAAQLDVDTAHPETADHAQTAIAMRGEVHRLQKIIEDLLRLTRGSHDPTAAGLVDLDDVALEGCARVTLPAHLSFDRSSISAATIRGDADQLARVVDNLLGNALRHATSTIAVATSTVGGQAILTVDDDGDGIAPDDRERVFDRLVRLDTARTRGDGGSGLGLALVKEIVEAHGGSVRVTTSPLGGARFDVTLPAA